MKTQDITQCQDILEYLRIICHLNYISDLLQYRDWAKVVETIDVDCFSLKQWQEAVHYLTSKEIEFTSCEAAKAFLLSHKKKGL